MLELFNENKLDLYFLPEAKAIERVSYSIIYALHTSNTYTIKEMFTLMIIQSDKKVFKRIYIEHNKSITFCSHDSMVKINNVFYIDSLN
jgi:hypothetical protein